jgi:cardiolipin synthase
MRKLRWLILAFALAGLAGCTAFSTRPNDWARRTLHIVPTPAEIGSAEFERQMDRRSRSCRTFHNAAEILENGAETYPEMLNAIRAAKTRINFCVYTFAPDRVGREFVDALAAAARRGARVRVIFDEFGSPDTPREFFQPIHDAGGEVRVFAPWWNWSFCRYDNRCHRKIVTVDGAEAFIGGLNVGVQHSGNNWRDVMLEVRGDAVAMLDLVFARTWQQAGFGWFHRNVPLLGINWLKNGVEWPLKLFAQKEPPLAAPPPDKYLPLRVVEQIPDRLDNHILNMLEYAVVCARKNVYLCTPYFIPPPRLARALAVATQRGVEVKILTQGPSDVPQIPPFAKEEVEKIERAGVNVFAWNRSILHGKYMTVDGKWVTVGSANADGRSLILNYEANVAATDAGLAREFERIFLSDVAKSERYADYHRAPPPPWWLRWLRYQF